MTNNLILSGFTANEPLRGLRQRSSKEIQPVRAEYRPSNLGRYDRPYFMQVSHGIYFRWTFFKTEATMEIRSYSQMPPTAGMRNMVRVPAQVFVKRDGYGLVAFPSRFEETVIEY